MKGFTAGLSSILLMRCEAQGNRWDTTGGTQAVGHNRWDTTGGHLIKAVVMAYVYLIRYKGGAGVGEALWPNRIGRA